MMHTPHTTPMANTISPSTTPKLFVLKQTARCGSTESWLKVGLDKVLGLHDITRGLWYLFCDLQTERTARDEKRWSRKDCLRSAVHAHIFISALGY